MKKVIHAVLAFALISSGAVTVSAQTSDKEKAATEKREHHFRHMRNFEEQVHKANALKIERLEIRKEIVQKKDKLFDLHVKAAEDSKKDKRSGKKAIWKDMKKIHQDLKVLKREAHETKKSMHEAMRADDEKLAKERMTEWLSINEKINNKLSEKSQKLDEIIKQYN
jgi:hypothetical protein